MEPLGMAARYPEQSRDRVFGDVDQAGGGPHSTPCAQMIDDGRFVLARETKPLACRVDTRESIEAGSLHAVLLEPSGLLSQGLHTTRRLLSTCVMITGHYRSKMSFPKSSPAEAVVRFRLGGA
jgi:hypothetical protein